MTAGRPRDSAADERILAATYRLILDNRLADVTMDGVASAAGVGKPTIYRRWASKEELVIEALAVHAPGLEVTFSGDLHADLVTLVRSLLQAPDVSAAHLLPRIVDEATGNPQVAKALWERVLRPRHDEIERVLAQAVADGQVRADIDLETTVALILGATLAAGVLAAITGGAQGDSGLTAERVVDSLWFGLRGEGGEPGV